MAKTLWRDRTAALDPETDFVEIMRALVLHEFPSRSPTPRWGC